MKIVSSEMIAGLLAQAADASRKRMNLNLHAEPEIRSTGFSMPDFTGVMFGRTDIGKGNGNS